MTPSPNSKKDPKEESLSPPTNVSNNTFDKDSIASFDSDVMEVLVKLHMQGAQHSKEYIRAASRLARDQKPLNSFYKPAEDELKNAQRSILSAFQELVERVRPKRNSKAKVQYLNGDIEWSEYRFIEGYAKGVKDFADALKKEISGE